MKVSFDSRQIVKLAKSLSNTTAFVDALSPYFKEASQQLYEAVFLSTPRRVSNLGGGLQKSIFVDTSKPLVCIVGADESKAHYAKFVIGGTRAHDIAPRNKKALRFSLGGVMGFTFAKLVKHKGTKPNPFVSETWARTQKDFVKTIDNGVKETLDAIGKL